MGGVAIRGGTGGERGGEGKEEREVRFCELRRGTEDAGEREGCEEGGARGVEEEKSEGEGEGEEEEEPGECGGEGIGEE